MSTDVQQRSNATPVSHHSGKRQIYLACVTNKMTAIDRYLEFRNMSILPDWMKIFAPNLVEDLPRLFGDNHMTDK